MPPVSSRLAVSSSRFFETRREPARRSSRRSWISGRARISAGRPRSSASPRLGKRRRRGVGERARASDQAAEVGRRRVQVGEHRRALVGEAAEVRHQRPQLARGSAGSRSMPARDVAAPLGGGLAGLVRLHDEVGERARARARAARAPVGVARQPGQHPVLARRGSSAPCRSRAAPGWRGGSPRSAPRRGRRAPVPNSFEQDREALAVGQAHDVVDQVEVHRRARVLDRQQALALAVALVDLASCRAAGACPARTPRTSRRSATAAGSCSCASVAERGEAARRRSAARPRPSCPSVTSMSTRSRRPARRRSSRPRPARRRGVVEDRAHL